MKRTILFITLFLSKNFSVLASPTVWDYDGDGKTDIALWGGENFENGDGRWKLVS